MKKFNIYLYTFIDNDYVDSMYQLLTSEDCKELINDIEKFYYDFEGFESIDNLWWYLLNANAHDDLLYYVSKANNIEDLTCGGIYNFTTELLDSLGVLLEFSSEIIKY